MPTLIKEPYTAEDLRKILHPYVDEWFFNKFKEFSLTQRFGVMEVHNRNNILISASTGGTKTLTAFLSILNELVNLSAEEKLEDRVYAVYVSPLKALSNDITINLQNPLKEITAIAKKHGKELNIRVAVRTGDTTQKEKARMLKHPPHILVTTPESLAILLASPRFSENLRSVQWMIVDEIHSLAEGKRGVHLSLTMERLNAMSEEMSRVGLSATVAPLEEIAKFLVGSREVKIADVQLTKKFDLQVISPVPDLINITERKKHEALYNLLDNLIQEHKTTLIFTNTRAGTERVVHHLKERFPKNYSENIGAHHGSLSKRHRIEIENGLREGKLKAAVCSTSLELGIDIGFIDLVICLGSPKSVARALQRFGRSGHRLHSTVKARFIVLDRDDLVECSVLLKNALEHKIDRVHIPTNCLDVLAQQIHGMAICDRWNADSMYELITKSYCYQNLKKEDFMDVVKYLAGQYISLEDRYIYAKIWYDEEHNEIGKRGKLARVLHTTNIGTIPDETSVVVKIGEVVVGDIDEAFLERMKRNDIFVLGGNTYQFLFARGMVAQVRAAEGKTPTVPSWFSESLPLSFDLGNDIQKFRRYMEDKFVNNVKKSEILHFLNEYLYVDDNAANAIYEYFREQYLYAEIPHDKKLLVEHYTDGEKKYVVFHNLYGRRVNDVLSRAVGYAIARINKRDVEIGISDNGFFMASNQPIQVVRAFNLLKPEELRKVMEKAIEKSEVLKRRFRHCATRALMILRTYKGHTKRVGRQQVSSMILLKAIRQISEDFSILKEARREVLEDLMDIENATKILEKITNREIELKEIHTSLPTPFAFNMVLEGYVDVLKIEDRVEFLRRMHQMVLAKIGKDNEI
ncbi:MAG TPA: ATP-dependent helicase [Candidatus Nanoarchaeia archaeon]|nr:ATP-dependent helicase [Candidatus Nanoarchaeia archaeon]